MIKRFCDICGREMIGLKFAEDLRNRQFSISNDGKLWDICIECREDLILWMKNRKEMYNATQS